MIEKLAEIVPKPAVLAAEPETAVPAPPHRPQVPTLIAELVGVSLKDREKKKARRVGDPKRHILRDVTMKIPSGAYAVLGEQSDRVALIDLLVGRRSASAGRLNLHTTFSYPIGRVIFFSLPVNGADFVRFLAKVYRFDDERALKILREVLPWPSVLSHRLDDTRNYQRLALSLGVAAFVDVETYVIDGNIVDAAFPTGFVRFVAENLAARTANRNIIISTRQPQVACGVAVDSLVIENCNLVVKEGVDPRMVKTAAETVVAEAPENEEVDAGDFF